MPRRRSACSAKLAAARDLTDSGPNCAGIIHLDPAWRFAATFLRDLPPGAAAGASNGLAFISQSGALAEEVIDKANARGLPLTSVVSVGNAVHLGVEHYLAWLGERPETGAALLYIESIEDHERFRRMARAGVPMFNDVEEMAEAAGLIARYPRLGYGARSDNLSDVRFRDRRGA